jgi:hypothetical protein
MRKATDVFRQVLQPATPANGAGGRNGRTSGAFRN